MEPPYSCPACGSESYHLVKSLGNLGRAVANLLIFAIIMGLCFLLNAWPEGGFGIGLVHRCNDCGEPFRISDQRKTGIIRCRKCNYDLRGNTSGVCPECGRKISARKMARIRKAEKVGGTPSVAATNATSERE